MRFIKEIHPIKFWLVLAAMVIAVASLYVSHSLISDLSAEERVRMEVWAEAMKNLQTADGNTDLTMVLKVLNANHTIPVIVVDQNEDVQTYRNIELSSADTIVSLKEKLSDFNREGNCIRIDLNGGGDYLNVYYGPSLMLTRLAVYPYVQLTVVLIFVLIAIFALLSSKKAEQNKVWVGLSKETAHQLGTPISSLMAWMVGADYIIEPGKPVGSIYGYVTDGRYEISDFAGYENGKWVLKDGVADDSGVVGVVRPGTLKLKNMTEGDNIVNDDDKTIIGDANAFAVGGFSINGRVKGFDLNANFTYSIGNDIYNADKIDQTSTRGSLWRNMSDEMAGGKRWTNIDANGNLVNDASVLATLNANTTMWSPYTTKAVIHTWAVEDGSFLRLANLTVGYTLPKGLMKKVYIENLRFYVTASNLFCLTGYSGADPEVDCKRNYLICPGVDYSAYPKSRQFVFGVNLTF